MSSNGGGTSSWLNWQFFLLIFVIIFMLVLDVMAIMRLGGSQICSVPVCIGDVSYDTAIGSFD